MLVTLKKPCWDCPGGAVVKNLSANAGHMGSVPGWGRFHMPLLKPMHPGAHAVTGEAPAVSSLLPTLERAYMQQQRLSAAPQN